MPLPLFFFQNFKLSASLPWAVRVLGVWAEAVSALGREGPIHRKFPEGGWACFAGSFVDSVQKLTGVGSVRSAA